MKGKSNIKKCLFALAIMLGAFISTENVFAATLTQENTGYYYDRHDQNGNNHHSWYFKNYSIGGEVAYCIEPGVVEGTDNYIQGYWSNTGLSNDVKEKVLLTAYYGYTYPGHQTLKFRAATQGKIWADILGNGTTVNFSTERWNAGAKLDVSAETAEIERLIASHYVKPSFNGQAYNLQVGQSITLHDNNGVLSNYSVQVNGANYSVNGNDLTITPTTNGNITIAMSKKMPYGNEYKIFYGDGIQNMLVAGSVDPVRASVRINSYYGQVEMNKLDSKTETSVPRGQATLEGAVYGVYKTDGTLVTKMTTDEKGYAKSDAVLSYGTYYLKEISRSNGYLLDETRYDFDSKGHALVKTNVKENVVENDINILKQYDYINGNTTIISAESGIKFEIYYPDGRLYDTIITDKNGHANIRMPYGIWKFHQVNTTDGFDKIYDFNVTVDYDSENEQYYNILNNMINAYLKLVKIDSETKEVIALANTTFKILNTDTNQYVSQYVGGKVYTEFKTDENGEFITYLKLTAGNYKLIEISEPNGYLIDPDGVDFKIGNDTNYSYSSYGAFVVVSFENAPIKGQIEVNKTGETVVIEGGKFTYEKLPLDGVKFEIYANEDIKSADGKHIYYHKGDLVDTIVSNKEGYAISKKLPLGSYYIVEVETKKDYVLDNKKYEFTLTEIDNKTAVVYESYSKLNYLKKGTLEFTKTDVTTGKGIPNTKIEVYHVNDNTDGEDELVFSGVTDKEGKVIITDLFVGKFYIVETEAATGYKISDEVVNFEIKENGEIVKAKMTNEKITSTIKVHKIDENGNPLKGVKIGVYDLNGNLIKSEITDENGDIEINVEYGSYYLQEIETIDGYELSDEKIYFDVTKDGELIQKTMVNETVEIEVPNTLSNSYINLVAGAIVLAGTGLIIISSIRKNKKRK